MDLAGRTGVRPGDTLDSWKAIAAYLQRDVRTVIRWERSKGLPVHRLPGGGKPGVYALKSELAAWWQGADPRPAPSDLRAADSRTPSIAVLPFANLSPDKEYEYFSDGLADEIITELTRVRGLRVTARTSSFAFRGHEQDVREIGKKLGVSTLLEGSVQRAAGRLRVSAQLVDAKSGFHLWSEQYDRHRGDVFTIQDEISHAIAGALELRLATSSALRHHRNQEAYNCWLKGRYYQHYENREAVARCRAHLQQAIALDSQFPEPLVDLAEQVRVAGDFGLISPADAFAEGQVCVNKALQLDPLLGEAHALSAAYLAWRDFEWQRASREFDRAIELAPGSAHVRRLRASYYLVPTGRLRDAQEEMELAVASDPVSPLAYIELGKVLLWARQFERAHAKMEAAFELRPDYPLAVWYRGVGFYFQGRLEEALELWQPAWHKFGGGPGGMQASIGMALGQLGRREEARAVLVCLEAGRATQYVRPTCFAQVHMGLGETAATLQWLARAIDERDHNVLDLPCKPIWDGLRNDPRFTTLLCKMRLV